MAAAARHNPADARVPCPLCGGLIHPIAGRCKHCKGDLSSLRGARPAAMAALPSLVGDTALQAPTFTHANQNGHIAQARGQLRPGQPPAPAPAPAPYSPVPTPAVPPAGQPILPPRPTGRMVAAAPQTGWWRHWPLIVIVLAGIAIVIAVVLMALPFDRKTNEDLGVKGGKLPAPDRMDTAPTIPDRTAPRSGDPWSSRGTTPDPPAPPSIDIPDDPDVLDPDIDPDIDPDDDPGATMPRIQGTGAIALWMMRHFCDRAETCGGMNPSIRDYCTETKKWPLAKPPASCSAAQRCFKHIDQLSCTFDYSDVTKLNAITVTLQDCVDAMSC
jgi:hypothetical protein